MKWACQKDAVKAEKKKTLQMVGVGMSKGLIEVMNKWLQTSQPSGERRAVWDVVGMGVS